jgi:hypothetical protein
MLEVLNKFYYKFLIFIIISLPSEGGPNEGGPKEGGPFMFLL